MYHTHFLFHIPVPVELYVHAFTLSGFTRLMVGKIASLRELPQLCLYANVFGSENTIF